MGTHWKSMMDRDYIGHFDLPEGRDAIVTIAKVQKGELKGGKKAKEHKPVIYFQGREKALIANSTNCKTLEGMYGPHVEGWIGKRITLYVTTTSSPDGTVPCIRIRPTPPNARATSTPEPSTEDAPFDDGGAK